jgi:hypothetical protein
LFAALAFFAVFFGTRFLVARFFAAAFRVTKMRFARFDEPTFLPTFLVRLPVRLNDFALRFDFFAMRHFGLAGRKGPNDNGRAIPGQTG